MTARSPPIADAQRSIAERVTGLGSALERLRPPAMIAVLAGAALWPVAAPLLGTGVVVGVAGGVTGLLGGPGQRFITDFLERARKRPPQDPHAEFERALLERMQAGDAAAAALRDDVAGLLRQVEGVEVALAAARDEARDALARGLADLGETWREFGWMLSQVHAALADVQARQAEALALQRAQLDLQREQLVKTNLLLSRGERKPVRAGRPPSGRRQRSPPADVRPPYKGLHRFEPEDADLFFGRDALRAELLARLAESHMLALIGDSGSGKSSVLRAGLVRAVWDGALPASSGWPVALLTPGAAPLEELAVRVAALLGATPGSLPTDLRADPGALGVALRQVMLDAPEGARLLLVVDQLEELFTMGAGESEQRAFLEALLLAAERPYTAIVLAIRSDFHGRLAAHPGLPEALRGNEVLVGPLAGEDLERAVEGPALQAGLAVEAGLAQLVAADVSDQPGALALVSHALLETFERRQGRTLTVAGYLDAGGVRGAIARTADSVLEGLTPAERAIARDVLLRLTGLGDGSQETRRRATLAELVPDPRRTNAVEAVVGRLVDARLLTSSRETVEIAHEALIRHWPTLRRWLEDDREGLRLHRRITDAAHQWRALGHDPGSLFRGAQLATASEWAADHSERLNPEERKFLEAARRAERDELAAARRRAMRLRALAGALAVLVAVAAGLAVQSTRQGDRARAAEALAKREADLATSQRLAAAAMDALPAELDRALLLSLESHLRAPTAEARGALITGLQASPRLRATLRHPTGTVSDAAFAGNGERLATSGSDRTVRLWDPDAARPVGAPLAAGEQVNAVVAGSDWLVAASADGLRAWTLGSPTRLAAQRLGTATTDIALAPGGTLLATVGSGGVHLRRLPDLAPVATLVRDGRGVGVTAVGFSRDGVTLATVAQGERVTRLWDRQGRRLGSLPASPTVRGLAIGAEHLATAGPSGLSLLATASGERLRQRDADLNAVALDDRDRRVAVANRNGTVQVFSVSDLRPVGPPLRGHVGEPSSVAFAPGGTLLASTGDDGTVRLWDLARSVALASAHAPVGPSSGAYDMAISGDGRRLISAGTNGRLRIWEGGRPVGEPFEVRSRFPAVALDARGRRFAVSGFITQGLAVWDVERGSRVALPDDEQHTAVALSPDGGLVAAAAHDAVVRVWDVASRRLRAEIAVGDEVEIGALTLAPDGRALAAADSDGFIRIWPLGGGRPRASFRADGETALAYSPDGRTLASAARRGIQLWDVAGGRRLGNRLQGHSAPVAAVAFDRAGVLTSADTRHGVVRWDPLLTSELREAWRERICRMVGRPLTRDEWRDVLPRSPYRPACG